MNKHTPGPWTVVTATRKGYTIYATKNYRYIVDHADEECRYGGIETEADALLIAAAPDLLEALEDLVSLCEAGLDSEFNIEAELEDARAAIAKATGEGEE